MADADYRRLGAACFCGEPVKLWSGRGRRPRYCLSHKEPPPQPQAKEQKECPVCRGFFVPRRPDQVCCSRLCRVRKRRGNKPRDELVRYTCEHCGKGFDSTHSARMYCSQACKKAGFLLKRPDRKAVYADRNRARSAPTLCAYFAKACERCGRADGARRDWSICARCKRADALAAAMVAAKAWNEARHKAMARTVACQECTSVFCPLYGQPGSWRLCVPCAAIRKRSLRSAHRDKRKAFERGVHSERVVKKVVFARDGWLCKLCGIETPEALQGTYEHNAPELDHANPVCRGGPHTYANTQCLCRSCNHFKGARTMEEVLAALVT